MLNRVGLVIAMAVFCLLVAPRPALAQRQTMIMDPIPLGAPVSVADSREYTRILNLQAGDKVRLEVQSPDPGELIVFIYGMTPRGFWGSHEEVVGTRMRRSGVFENVVRHGGQYFIWIMDGGVFGNRAIDFTYTVTVLEGPSAKLTRQVVASAPSSLAEANPASAARTIAIADAADSAGAPSFNVQERFATTAAGVYYPYGVRPGSRVTLAARGCEAQYELKIAQEGFFGPRVRAQSSGASPQLTFNAEKGAPYHLEHRTLNARPADYFLLASWNAEERPSADQMAELIPNCEPLSDTDLRRVFGPLVDRVGRTFVDGSYTRSQTYRWHRNGVLERVEAPLGSTAGSTHTYYVVARRTGRLNVVDQAGFRHFGAADAATLYDTPFSAERYAAIQASRAAERARNRNETLGFIGGVLGGVGVALASEGTATQDQISTAIALGSNVLGPGSGIANAASRDYEAVLARQAQERQQLVELVARLNDPNDPVTRDFKAADDRRREAYRATTARLRAEQDQADRDAAAEAQAYEARRDAEFATAAVQRRNAEAAAETSARQQRQAEADRRAAQARATQEQAERARQETIRRQSEQQAADDRAAREREAEQRAAAERRDREAAEAERRRPVAWPEAVAFCQLRPNSRTEFRCDGPLQATYGTPGTPSYTVAVRQACGSDTVRELGTTNGYTAWGCGFGIRVNAQNRFGAFTDPATRLGIGYVPGRIIFRCPPSTNTCRTR